MTRYLLIKAHAGNAPDQIIPLRPTDKTHRVVERWQRSTTNAQVTGRPTPCTYQVHEGDIVSALVASTKI